MHTKQEYRSTVGRLGFALLIFFAGFLILQGVMMLLPYLTDTMQASAKSMIEDLTLAALYAGVFLLPLAFFALITRDAPRAPMQLGFSLPRMAPFYLFAGLAVISAAAYLNSFLVGLLEGVLPIAEGTAAPELHSNLQVILYFLTVAVIPAFVEELLFRGLVLSNLLPFGRGFAVVASAVLFGLMHQSLDQLLYATVAGLVLGYLYVKFSSIWMCVLLHFINNFQSVFRTILLERLDDSGDNAVLALLLGTLFALGIFSFVVILLHEKPYVARKKEDGASEPQVEAPCTEQGEMPLSNELSTRELVRGFFHPTMAVFVALCLISAIGSMLLPIWL